MKFRQAVVIALAAVAGVVFVALRSSNDQVPELSLQTLAGQRLNLAQWRGKPVLVIFWASTCPPCVKEIPQLVRLYQTLHPRGLELVAITMAYDPPNHAVQAVQQYRIPYPVALDLDSTAAKSFGDIKLIPAAFLISPEGLIVQRYLGEMDLDRVRQAILPML